MPVRSANQTDSSGGELGLVAGFFFLFVGLFLRLRRGFDFEVNLRRELVVDVNFDVILAKRPTRGRLGQRKLSLHVTFSGYCLFLDLRSLCSRVANIVGNPSATNVVALTCSFGFEDGIKSRGICRIGS